MSEVKFHLNNVNMQKRGLADNRNWFVFIVCTTSITIAVLGVFITHFFIGKEYIDEFVITWNIFFLCFWFVMIIAEKKKRIKNYIFG